MKALLILAALLVGTAHADEMVSRIGALTVRLIGSRCVAPDLVRHIREDAREQWKAGVAEMSGHTLRLCWAVGNDGVVVILNETGTVDFVPVTAFVRDQGI